MVRLLSVLALLFVADGVAAQVTIRERVAVPPSASALPSPVDADCSGSEVAQVVFRAAQRVGTVAQAWGAPLEGSVTVETACGRTTTGQLAPAFVLERTSEWTFGGHPVTQYFYEAAPGAVVLRAPLHRGDYVVAVTYAGAGAEYVVDVEAGGGFGSGASLGCLPATCDPRGVHIRFETAAVVEGLATGFGGFPSAVGCGSETDLVVLGTRDGGEGYVDARTEVEVSVSRGGPFRASDVGTLVSEDQTSWRVDAAFGHLAAGGVRYRAPACSYVARPVTVRLRAYGGRESGEAITYVTPPAERLDLAVDADGDGDLDEDDEPAEFSDVRVGALVPFNDDDDDDNGRSDLYDRGTQDPDLGLVLVSAPAGPGAVRLEAIGGDGAVALWRDPAKRDSVSLPLDLPASALPAVLYAEGVRWGAAPTVLRLSAVGGASAAADTVRLHSGSPTLGLPDGLPTGAVVEGALSGLPDGTEVELVVRKNNRIVARRVTTVDGRTPYAFAEAAGVPNDRVRVEAWGDAPPAGRARLLASEETWVVPGPPAVVTLSRADQRPLVANGRTTTSVVARVADADGYPVEGVAVSLLATEWFGEDRGTGPVSGASTRPTNRRGEAVFPLRAPATGDAVVHVSAGGVESDPLVLDYARPTLSLSADASVLDVTAGGAARVTLTTDAPWGSPVEWFVSHAEPGRLAAYSYLVQHDGTSGIDVRADGAPVGDVLVSARVGDAWAYTTLRFESSAPVSAELGQRVLVGDLAGPAAGGDGSVPFAYETTYEPVGPPDAAGVPQGRGPTEPFYRGDVRLFGATDLTVRGAPGTTYAVAFEDSSQAGLLDLDGLAPGGRVTTDSAGVARVRVRSTGAAAFAPDEAFRRVALTVRAVPPPDGPPAAVAALRLDEDPWTEYVYLAPATVQSRVVDFVVGFIGGDPDAAWGIAGAFAGGMVAIADIGALAKNLYRSFVGSDVNELEVVLSAIGLATELAVGTGEAADVPVSAVRAITAFDRGGPFSRSLLWMLRVGVRNGRDLGDIGRFALKAVRNPGYLVSARAGLTSTDLVESAVRAADHPDVGRPYVRSVDALTRTCRSVPRFAPSAEDAWAGAVVTASGPSEVGAPSRRRLPTDQCGLSTEAFTTVTELFDSVSLPSRLKADFRRVSQQHGEAAADALSERLIRASSVGRLGQASLKSLFDANVYAPAAVVFRSNRTIATEYLPEDAIDDLPDVVAKLPADDLARHGLLALVNRIGAQGHQIAFRYELEVAADLARDPSVQFVRVSVPVPGLNGGTSDVDVVADGIAYQVKLNSEAFSKSGRGGLEPSVQDYVDIIDRARAPSYKGVVYVSPARRPADRIGATRNAIDRMSLLSADLRHLFPTTPLSLREVPLR